LLVLDKTLDTLIRGELVLMLLWRFYGIKHNSTESLSLEVECGR
jgi:hypothetical protein